MTRHRFDWIVLALLALAVGACTDGVEPSEALSDDGIGATLAYRDASPSLSIVSPADGATVRSPLTIEVATAELTLAPAGRTRAGEGHWHLLVDQGCRRPGDVIPADGTSIHVGSGASTLTVELPPGRHDLCAQIGDGFHVAVAITDTIRVDVAEPEPLDRLQPSEVTR